MQGELSRQAKRSGQAKLVEADLPRLWILTPTLSTEKLADFGAIKDVETWGEGIYLLPKSFKTGIVVIHQLPETSDTLWLRMMGRDNVQIRAITELTQLPTDNLYRQNALELFSNLKIILDIKQSKNTDEAELMVKLSPLYLEQIEIATQKGQADGVVIGRVAKGQSLIIRLLTRKFGEINPETIEAINRLTLEQLESLGDALLDFNSIADLLSWLA